MIEERRFQEFNWINENTPWDLSDVQPGDVMYSSDREKVKPFISTGSPIVINPGEYGYSTGYYYCSQVLLKDGDKIIPIHVLPNTDKDELLEQKSNSSIVSLIRSNLIEQGLYDPNRGISEGMIKDIYDETISVQKKFDSAIVIGRFTEYHAQMLKPFVSGLIQVVALPENFNHESDKQEPFKIILYNDPNNPGDLTNFDIRTR